MINIKGLYRPSVLKVLYDNSKVQGMGFLNTREQELTIYSAELLLCQGTNFDYLFGKVMKVNLDSDDEFDEWLYDRDNGFGSAQRAIDKLREGEK